MKKPYQYLRLIRPEHSLKNVLVYVPAFFDLKFFRPDTFFRASAGFLVFSLAASSIYVFNDIKDAGNDRLHARKSQRPLAAGTVSVHEAYAVMGGLLVLALALMAVLWRKFGIREGYAWLGLYWLMNVAYSMGLKRVPVLDISVLASGFVIRLLFGAGIAGVPCSFWLYMTVMMLSFYMGLGKRRGELAGCGEKAGEVRGVLRHYSVEYLDKNMYMCLGLAIMFYALWSVSDASVRKFGTDRQIWTVPFVLMMSMRYGMDIEQGHGDPIEIIRSDGWLRLLAAMYAAILFSIFYLGDGLLKASAF